MATSEVALVGLTPPLNEQETSLLAALLHPSTRLSVVIPGDAGREDLLHHLTVCCRAAVWAETTFRKINPVIGRLLSVIKRRPDALTGYADFTAFMEQYVVGRMGYSRSGAYESMRLSDAHPSLTGERWVQIGTNRLGILAKFSKEGEPSYEKYLAVASQCATDREFKQWAHDKGYIDKGEIGFVDFLFEKLKPNTRDHCISFLADPKVHVAAGGESHDSILSNMLAECSSWLSADGHRPVMQISDVAFVWSCTKCKAVGVVPSGYPGTTLNHLRNYLHEIHLEASRDCDQQVGELGFQKADQAADEAPEIESDQEPPIE